MHIILVRIPAETTPRDIAHFLEPVLKGGLFVRKGIIEKIEIQILHDDRINATEYHGLVKIEPDAAAQRVIKKLNRKAINGKHIAVREYHIRNWHNDPRLRPKPLNLEFSCRREGDRRRTHLQVLTNNEVRFTSNKRFHRTF
jgi:hypothetical protein